jgi:sporulation protein YhbH
MSDFTAHRIDQDVGRFRQIVRGHVRRNLRKYMSNGELIGRQGKELVSIPVPQIQLPHFRFGDKQSGGVGQGEGDVGTPVGPGDQDGGQGAGDQPGQHIMEVEMSLEELAAILGEELELPRIEPKGKESVEGEIVRYTGIRRVGPESLRSFKRTYRAALKRQVSLGLYDPQNPVIIPIRDDVRYRSWNVYPKPQNNAVIIYMMDVSGSMTRNKKELVRLTAFWIDTWLRANYKNLKVRYIVHDANAGEVDAQTFYNLRESGGTRISSAYQYCRNMIEKEYDPKEWNIYGFHFSDGENFGGEDDKICLGLLQGFLLPSMNLFGYGQVPGGYGRMFMATITTIEDERLVSTKIKDRDDIFAAIKTFLGKGL